ncbi:MAG: Gfo/Idh/MocA family protein [bacterium]
MRKEVSSRKKKCLRVGILGTGFGRVHADVYNNMKGVKIAGIFGRSDEKLNELKNGLKVKTTNDIYELINDPSIDLIDVCLPTDIHSKYVTEALKNGKDVFCETPVSYTIDEAEKMKKCAEKYNKKLFVNLFYKFSAPHKYAADMINSNKIGKPLILTAYNKTAPVWGDLGLDKIIMNFMIHNFDFITEIMAEPIEVSASGFEFGTRSHAVSSLIFKNGFATIESSSIMPEGYPFSLGFDLICENGAITYKGQYGEDSFEGTILYKVKNQPKEISLEENDELNEAIKHVLNCIRENKQSPIISIEHAIKSLKIASIVSKSIKK